MSQDAPKPIKLPETNEQRLARLERHARRQVKLERIIRRLLWMGAGLAALGAVKEIIAWLTQ